MSTFDIVCKASAGTGASAGAAASGATVETIGAKAAAVEHTTAARSWRAIFNESAGGRRVSVVFCAAISVALGGAATARCWRKRRCSSERRDAAGHEQQHCRSAGLRPERADDCSNSSGSL